MDFKPWWPPRQQRRGTEAKDQKQGKLSASKGQLRGCARSRAGVWGDRKGQVRRVSRCCKTRSCSLTTHTQCCRMATFMSGASVHVLVCLFQCFYPKFIWKQKKYSYQTVLSCHKKVMHYTMLSEFVKLGMG